MLEKNQRKIEELADFFYGRDLKEIMEKLETVTVGQDQHG